MRCMRMVQKTIGVTMSRESKNQLLERVRQLEKENYELKQKLNEEAVKYARLKRKIDDVMALFEQLKKKK